MPQLKAIAGNVARGDFSAARKAVLDLDPDAQKTHWQVEAGSTGDDPRIAEKTEAVLRKMNQTVTSLMKTHMVADIVRDIVISSVVLAVAAPAGAALLTGIAKTAYSAANVAMTIPKVGSVIAMGLRVTAALEHGAIRLARSPGRQHPAPEDGYRAILTATASAAQRGGPARGLRRHVGVSGINRAMNDRGPGLRRRTPGASWGAKKPVPICLALDGLRGDDVRPPPIAGRPRPRGNTFAAGQSVITRSGRAGACTGANLFDQGLSRSRPGQASQGPTTGAMADQFAKYYAFNKAVERASRVLYRMHSVDGNDVERASSAPSRPACSRWRPPPGIPPGPSSPPSAKTAAAVADQQRSQQGFAEYKASGETHRIANAAADIAELPLKNAPSRPFITKVFEFNLMEAVGEKGNFKVTKDMKYQAIQFELEKAVASAGGKVNPYQYFSISQQESGMAGRLHITDEVRDQAQGMFEKAVLADLTIIGEAARHVPRDVCISHPDVPWAEMRDMRNFVVHGYFRADAAIVWRTIQQDLPPTASALRRGLATTTAEGGDPASA